MKNSSETNILTKVFIWGIIGVSIGLIIATMIYL